MRPTPRIPTAGLVVAPIVAAPFLAALAHESLCVIARGSGATQRRVLLELLMRRGLSVSLPRGMGAD